MTQPDHAESLRLIEALLFASAAPVTEGEIADRLPDGTDVPALLAELEGHYRERGVLLAKIAGGWTFRTAHDLAQRLKLAPTMQRRLSRAAVETLAIVAYHQPVTRAEIEEIRGVQISKGTIDTLMEAGWIVPKGRRETVGRPVTWGTSDAFLHHFSLGDVTDLPGMEELKAAGLIGGRAPIALRESALPQEVPAPPGETETDEPPPEIEALIDEAGLARREGD